MGLDITLYHFHDDDPEKYLERRHTFKEEEDAAYEAFYAGTDAEKYSQLTEAQKESLEEALQELRDRYEVDRYGEPLDNTYTAITEDSEKYPDHLFKVGYFRSSYNKAGINTILRNRIGEDLYGIFGTHFDVDAPYVRVDWEESLDRARNILERFREDVEEYGNFRVKKLMYNPFKDKEEETITNERKALEAFRAEQIVNERSEARGSSPPTQYHSRNGEFYRDGFEVRGFIEGLDEMTGDGCIYAVYESEVDEGADTAFDWYFKALEVIIETIEYVLEQPDPERYIFLWSA